MKIYIDGVEVLCDKNITIEEDAAYELAKRSRGTPRIANRLFKRVRDYALVLGNGKIDLKIGLEKLICEN